MSEMIPILWVVSVGMVVIIFFLENILHELKKISRSEPAGKETK